MLVDLTDTGFLAAQALFFRKLLEQASEEDARQVICLRRVVDDMATHRGLFTREDSVAFDGAPFDPDPDREKEDWQCRTMIDREESVATQ